jgi:signal transduction histidine kinase
MSSLGHRRSFIVDSAMALAVFLVVLVTLGAPAGADSYHEIDPLFYLLIAAQTLTLAWWRRYPVGVLSVVIVAFMIERALNYPPNLAMIGIIFALYSVGTQLPKRRSAIVGAIAIIVVVAWTGAGVVSYGVPAAAMVSAFGFMILPLILGREAHRREQRSLELEARAIRAEFERERRASDAVSEERGRIARELHDVVAHEVTIMTIQAAAAGKVLASDPDQARVALGAIEQSGHRALTEMRRLLGLIRTDVDADLAPQPGLDLLETLIDVMNDSGISVELRIEGTPRSVPSGIDLNAYRIIQECLTNVVKHGGPGVSAVVLVSYTDAELQVAVTDDGMGAAQALTGNGSGQGHVGMRERVALINGTLVTGPRPGGGYGMRATIPLPSP